MRILHYPRKPLCTFKDWFFYSLSKNICLVVGDVGVVVGRLGLGIQNIDLNNDKKAILYFSFLQTYINGFIAVEHENKIIVKTFASGWSGNNLDTMATGVVVKINAGECL